MCHGEIRCGFFFLVESDITIFLPSTIGFFCFQPLFNKVKKVKSSHFSFSVELTSPYECDELTSVKLSDNIPEIGDWTFTRCYKLKSINIPKNLKRLGDYAFLACNSIEELNLPCTLTDISKSSLLGCYGIRSLTVEEGNPEYLSENGVLYNHAKTTLLFFPAQSEMTYYDIPATVITIAPGAFSGSQLKGITLPPTMTEIGNDAFGGLEKLESITIPSSVSRIGFGAFIGCSSLKEVIVPENVNSIERAAFSGCQSLIRIHLPEGLTRIEGWTFDGCTSLSDVNIPEGINYIGIAAFRNCSSLPDFQIPEGVTIIDDEAFKGCKTMTVLSIPDNVENVGWDAFMRCSGLEKVTIGHSVKALEGGTFYGCDKIKEIWSYIEEPFDVIDYDYKPGGVLVDGRCFPEVVTREAILYVPQGTKEKYLDRRGWRDFTNIHDILQTGIQVSTSADNSTCLIYDLSGRRVHGKPQKGVYIQGGKEVVIK